MSQLTHALKFLITETHRTKLRQRRTLFRGLEIQVELEPDSQTFLALIRTGDVYPSDQEWKTVLDHWPEPTPSPRPEPTRRKEGRRHILFARWPSPLVAQSVTVNEDPSQPLAQTDR